MTRKLAAALSALSFILCFSGAMALAADSGRTGARSCCRHCAPAAPAKGDCCVTTAAVGAVRLVRVDAPALAVAVPAFPAAPVLSSEVPRLAAPPGAATYRAAAPARAPPLA
ncbi:MAG: hypothetical protein ACHQ49_06185 [Elusimicrobiota bacterium]